MPLSTTVLFLFFLCGKPDKEFANPFYIHCNVDALVKQPQAIGECQNPLREVEQDSRPDRDSGVNPGLKQTN